MEGKKEHHKYSVSVEMCFVSSSGLENVRHSKHRFIFPLGLRAERPGFDYWEGGIFSLHQHIQTGSGVHPASYSMGTEGSFPGVKRVVCEADHSSPSSAEIKDTQSHTSTPPLRPHGVVLS
jgi:hypothetical protein